jgi:predicted phosphodiesterase
MRVAVLCDIHANLPALDAVLQELRRANVDGVVIGGDVLPGPMPRETIARLLALDLPVHFVLGNGDREVLARMRGEETGGVAERFQGVIRWVAAQLEPDGEAVLGTWTPQVRLGVDGLGEVLFCHATPRNDTEIFTRLTPEARLLPVFAGAGAPVVVCGHTHMPFDRRVGAVRVVNAGSVGMPFGATGADWLVLGPDVEPRHTGYDLADAAARVRATGYPKAEEFATRYVLRAPTEQETLAAFAASELGRS